MICKLKEEVVGERITELEGNNSLKGFLCVTGETWMKRRFPGEKTNREKRGP